MIFIIKGVNCKETSIKPTPNPLFDLNLTCPSPFAAACSLDSVWDLYDAAAGRRSSSAERPFARRILEVRTGSGGHKCPNSIYLLNIIVVMFLHASSKWAACSCPAQKSTMFDPFDLPQAGPEFVQTLYHI